MLCKALGLYTPGTVIVGARRAVPLPFNIFSTKLQQEKVPSLKTDYGRITGTKEKGDQGCNHGSGNQSLR